MSEMTHYFDQSANPETLAAIRSLKLKLMTYASNVAAMQRPRH